MNARHWTPAKVALSLIAASAALGPFFLELSSVEAAMRIVGGLGLLLFAIGLDQADRVREFERLKEVRGRIEAAAAAALAARESGGGGYAR